MSASVKPQSPNIIIRIPSITRHTRVSHHARQLVFLRAFIPKEILDSFAYGLAVEEDHTSIKCRECVAQLLKVQAQLEGAKRRFVDMNDQMNEAAPPETEPVPGPIEPDPVEPVEPDLPPAQGWITYVGAAVVIAAGAFGYYKNEIDFFAFLMIIGVGLTIAGVRNAFAKMISAFVKK